LAGMIKLFKKSGRRGGRGDKLRKSALRVLWAQESLS